METIALEVDHFPLSSTYSLKAYLGSSDLNGGLRMRHSLLQPTKCTNVRLTSYIQIISSMSWQAPKSLKTRVPNRNGKVARRFSPH
jgi:hypothetical protein